MSDTTLPYPKLATMRDVNAFRDHCLKSGISLPCDDTLQDCTTSSLALPLTIAGNKLSNRFAIQPMEGWDANADGTPSEQTMRRWQRSDWGDDEEDMVWWCTEAPEAYVGDRPVIESLGDELQAMIGTEVYVELRRRLD